MSLIVKICGLSTRETLDVALQAGADMVGFVFFPPSPRHISLETARELGKQAKGRATKVALTVDADDATLANIVEALQPDILQVHGKETVARLRDIKQSLRIAGHEGDGGGDRGRSCAAAGLCRGRRSHPVRCPRAQGRHASRRPRRRVRLACAGKSRSQAAVHGLGRPACRQCRGSRARHPRRRRRCFLGRRAHARHQGSRDDPHLSFAPRAPPKS